LGYSGIRIYSGIYSGYSAPGSRIAGMEIQVFRNENSSQTNAYSHYSNYPYSGLIPNERALSSSSVVAADRKEGYIVEKVTQNNLTLGILKTPQWNLSSLKIA